MEDEELREVRSFKVVLNKKTKKWVALAKFRNNKTKIAAFFSSRKEAQEYLKLLDDRTRSLRGRRFQGEKSRLSASGEA